MVGPGLCTSALSLLFQQMNTFSSLWKRLGHLGAEHCSTLHDRKVVRFMNRLAPVCGSVGLIYLGLLKLKFGVLSAGLDIFQVLCSVSLLCIPSLNKRGRILASKIVMCLVPVALIMAICIAVGRADGGTNMFFASAIMPLMLFRERWMYIFFFSMSVIGFYFANYYLDHHEPLVKIPAEFLELSFKGNMFILFLLFFFMVHFLIGTGNYYEAELQKSKEVIEQKNKDIMDSIHYAKKIQLSLHPTAKYIERCLERLRKSEKPQSR